MDPASVVNSFTGVVAIVMIFAIPILAIVATLVIVFTAINRSHRERMKMIEQGMVPAPTRKRTGNYYALLIIGAICLAFGLAMVVLTLVSTESEWEPGLIFGFVGLALLACFVFIRANRRRQQALEGPGRPEDPRPPLT